MSGRALKGQLTSGYTGPTKRLEQVAADARGGSVAAVAHRRMRVFLSGSMPCCPQYVLEWWVIGCLLVGWLLLIAGARAAGAALLGSAAGALVVFFTPLHSGHLESLVHNAVIAASVGLVVFGLAGLALGADHPLGRYPIALALALATIVVGTLMILRIHAEAAPSCSLFTGLPVTNISSPFAASCFRGFEDRWLQALLAFNVAFLALLFLVQAWQATRSLEKQQQDDGTKVAAWGR
jgi:hypothetical protein